MARTATGPGPRDEGEAEDGGEEEEGHAAVAQGRDEELGEEGEDGEGDGEEGVLPLRRVEEPLEARAGALGGRPCRSPGRGLCRWAPRPA